MDQARYGNSMGILFYSTIFVINSTIQYMKVHQDVLIRIEDFFAHSQMLAYAKGQGVLRPEDAPYGVYYLKKGYIRQYLLSPSGDTFVVHIYKSGSFSRCHGFLMTHRTCIILRR